MRPPEPGRENGLRLYQRIFAGERGGSLDLASLPTPEKYLRGHGLLTQQPRGTWTAIRCPVHKAGDERNPSMRVNLADGHFRCMACGASGGDLVALHRLFTGLGFRDAVHDLGGRIHG